MIYKTISYNSATAVTLYTERTVTRTKSAGKSVQGKTLTIPRPKGLRKMNAHGTFAIMAKTYEIPPKKIP